ncbi:MAG: opioid growth factor receptor-related protein [Brevundimonas sp.]|uniref:opioid growth factor receptor-related protein n=1 Tax=Brevundimonas sp. TaxID=1871086 RepID=UPI002723105D|nr:opioid growth factor receptor-related protein [Brevundimonas sp.]MDO9586411.1 opioid growth factor receptor-related protein [Brevundimonas sp.]MDP3656133.1 opioid growth factor receptor-related protein [Brevundimonas sp.]MDZ4114155.1 opioid growth factor receptor-related protein [Brevundimonas sp.]
MAAAAVVAFLEGEGPDARGRTVFEILAMNDVVLERSHDFIQWLFPLPEPSAAVPDAPVLTPDDIRAIRESELAPAALAAATDRMANFYRSTHDWLMPNDHNHRRITRIIRSLRLLAGDAEAEAFRAFIMARVEATRAPISARSRGYWATA